ncbi:MAG TPA: hypothetical protein VHU77_06845 [Candidatus Limnocylindria bacterium]|nr:hypothetical protein [Candidatus Limnocylindria bacterium]
MRTPAIGSRFTRMMAWSLVAAFAMATAALVEGIALISRRG